MNKQELARRIVRDMGYDYQTVRNIIDGIAFEGWLHNPDQVPERTITASERDSRTALLSPTEKFGWIKGFEDAGGRVVPDPEPTNAEKLKAVLDAIGDSTAGYREHLASKLDEAGVKAPGGDDEC